MEYPRNPNTNCIVCNNPIYRRPSEITKSNGHVFCGLLCYGKFNRKEKPCIVCGTLMMTSLNKKTCSRACANKNRAGIQYKINRPHDKVVDQRLLKLRLIKCRGAVCEICCYNKMEILQVHHQDRNHKNNDLKNLKLICPNCHFEEHYLEKSWLKNYDFKSSALFQTNSD